ncbi:MAG: hypothetical protein HY520_04525 [Candidatus Aenigmarchaeota archaeon]|nr:hypothetical protein [Candidatus Aenigmarchaeota archaeon]
MVLYKRKPEMESSWKGGEYKQTDIEELYELPEFEQRSPKKEERPEREERVVREVVIHKQATPRLDDQPFSTLQLLGPEVIGSLFDRVRFLGERIKELSEAVKLRDKIHQEMMADIDVDIKEKTVMESRLADVNEKRNFKMDISMLRKEKRRENVEFWKDLVEVREQLRENLELYQTEKKILAIFKDLGGTEGEKA